LGFALPWLLAPSQHAHWGRGKIPEEQKGKKRTKYHSLKGAMRVMGEKRMWTRKRRLSNEKTKEYLQVFVLER